MPFLVVSFGTPLPPFGPFSFLLSFALSFGHALPPVLFPSSRKVAEEKEFGSLAAIQVLVSNALKRTVLYCI